MQYLALILIAAVFLADLFLPAAIAFFLLLSPSTASTGRHWLGGWLGAMCGFAVYSVGAIALYVAVAIGLNCWGAGDQSATIVLLLAMVVSPLAALAGSIHGFLTGYFMARKRGPGLVAATPAAQSGPPLRFAGPPPVPTWLVRRPLWPKLVSTAVLAPLLALISTYILALMADKCLDLFSGSVDLTAFAVCVVLVYGALLWLIWRPRIPNA